MAEYEMKNNPIKMLENEIDRLNKTDGLRIASLSKQEVVA